MKVWLPRLRYGSGLHIDRDPRDGSWAVLLLWNGRFFFSRDPNLRENIWRKTGERLSDRYPGFDAPVWLHRLLWRQPSAHDQVGGHLSEKASTLRRIIVRAARTCTLWVPDCRMDVLRFRFWPHWYITGIELVETG